MNRNHYEHGGRIFAVARELGLAPEEIVDFSASINPLGSPAGVRRAVVAAFDRLVHYPESDCRGLATALADHHGLQPENVCVGNGSTELIYLLPRLAAGGRALLIAPTFSEYARALGQAGWSIDPFPLAAEDGFSLDLPALGEEVAKGYDLLFLCNPGNPTGRLYGREEVAALLGICREAGTLLVLDEAFMDFCEEESAKGEVVASGAGVVLRSMTKFYAFPGLRLGYLLAAPPLAGRLAALRQPWSVNSLAQAAGLAALADREHDERSRAYVAAERAFLAAGVAKIPALQVYPAAANYLLVRIEDGMTAPRLQERLLAERLLIRECSGFAGLDGRFFRIAVRVRGENERLLQALARVFREGR